jgi:hypothetical protein
VLLVNDNAHEVQAITPAPAQTYASLAALHEGAAHTARYAHPTATCMCGLARASRLTHHFSVVCRDLKMVAERVSEVHRPGPCVIYDASGPGSLLKSELRQPSKESQPLRTGESKGDPVKACCRPASLRLAGKEGELGLTAVGREHERSLGMACPHLSAGDRAAPEYAPVPLGRLGPVRHEDLDVIQSEAERPILAHRNAPTCSAPV